MIGVRVENSDELLKPRKQFISYVISGLKYVLLLLSTLFRRRGMMTEMAVAKEKKLTVVPDYLLSCPLDTLSIIVVL